MHELRVLASTQFGVFSRRQAHSCNVTDRMLQTRVANGELERLGPGLYRIAGSPSSWHQRVLTACLGGGEQCVASHRTAAALHRFDGFSARTIEVSVPRSVRYRTGLAVVHQSLDLEPQDRCHVGPIPVTTPSRTLIDLGAVNGWQRVEEAFDGAERDQTTARIAVADRHREIRKRGRRGVGPMAVVLDRRSALPHSVLERRFLRLLDNAGIELPELQYQLRLPNGRRAFLDAAHVRLRLGWELDGHGSHATRKQRAADNIRANHILNLGWELRRFTYEQVMREGAYVVHTVRTALHARSCGT